MSLKKLCIIGGVSLIAASAAVSETQKLAPNHATVGGKWLHSAGMDTNSSKNPHYKFLYKSPSGDVPLPWNMVWFSLVGADADAFLIIVDKDGEVVAKNDDGGVGTNALVQTSELKYNEEYKVVVGTFGDGQKGYYTLTTSQGMLEPLPAEFKKIIGDAASEAGVDCGTGYRVASRQDFITNKAMAKAEIDPDDIVRLDYGWVVFGKNFPVKFSKFEDETQYSLCASEAWF